MAIRFEKKSDGNKDDDKKPKEDAKSQNKELDSDTYASLQKPEKKAKKKRF